MNIQLILLAGTVLVLGPGLVSAQVVSAWERTEGTGFHFKDVPPPADNDAATTALFTVAAGDRDPNGGDLAVLHDGQVPQEGDEPAGNFFFRAGTAGGRIKVDLGKTISIKQINTYSWHPGTRGPQIYTVYGAEHAASMGENLRDSGWKSIADVNTRPRGQGEPGGQYGVSISHENGGSLGQYRYLLFDIARTEDQDPFGNTFYSEIDVLDANGPAPHSALAAAATPILLPFETADGKFHFTIDATAAPELADWAKSELEPVVQKWYPKLVALLPSSGFEAAREVTLRFRNNMGGTPAATGGSRIDLNSGWFRRELKREARGAVVHEMVHVVQSYGRARRTNPNATRTPGWLVEGIADYVRWFIYEPESKGAEITARNIARARYNTSYRVTANFLNSVSDKYDKNLVPKLNAAAREGRYTEALWKELAGHTVEDLGEEWLKANQARIDAQKGVSSTAADPLGGWALAKGEQNPYRAQSWPTRTTVVYRRDQPPRTPALEELLLTNRLSQFGITWEFDQPVRVGKFVNGDWYVVGPATVARITPRPLYGAEIPADQLDHMDQERPEAQRVRNGFMVNPPARMKVSYDSGVRNWFDPALIQHLPAHLSSGDALVSTISMAKGLVLDAPLRNRIERGVEDCSPIRTAAVLTCVRAPQPPDAFRPAFCDREQRIYLSRNLQRELLPSLRGPQSRPDVRQYVRFTERPWVGTCFFGFEEPVENMPQYGLEYGRVAGISALLLCTDLQAEEKEPLLIGLTQVGIDLGGIVRAGHPGWTGWGGHGSGRKLPIVFAGMLLGDEELANINRSFPKVSFGEDEQTAYGKCWTGATVVFAGHSGIDVITGAGRSRDHGWGPYEHRPPSEWRDGQNLSESYRRCCTSVGWVAQALALRLMHAEPIWHHDAFFDYVDRWMQEDDAEFVKTIREKTGHDHDHEWSHQGQAWDAFVNDMWRAHRSSLPASLDSWKQPHDDSYYLAAIRKMEMR